MIYFISNNGVQKGPLTFEQLKEQEINNNTLVWKEGTSDWVKASEVEELVAILELMPPPVDAVLAGSALVDTDLEARNDTLGAEVRDDDAANEEAEAKGAKREVEEEKTPRKVIDNTRMFTHFLTFRGRSRRTEYWVSYVICGSFLRACHTLTTQGNSGWGAVMLIIGMYIYFSTGVRRCHDRGHSGFYILIPLYYIYLMFAGSVPGDNKYGNNPKGENFKKLY